MCAGKLKSLVQGQGQGEEVCGECVWVNCYHWYMARGKRSAVSVYG